MLELQGVRLANFSLVTAWLSTSLTWDGPWSSGALQCDVREVNSSYAACVVPPGIGTGWRVAVVNHEVRVLKKMIGKRVSIAAHVNDDVCFLWVQIFCWFKTCLGVSLAARKAHMFSRALCVLL